MDILLGLWILYKSSLLAVFSDTVFAWERLDTLSLIPGGSEIAGSSLSLHWYPRLGRGVITVGQRRDLYFISITTVVDVYILFLCKVECPDSPLDMLWNYLLWRGKDTLFLQGGHGSSGSACCLQWYHVGEKITCCCQEEVRTLAPYLAFLILLQQYSWVHPHSPSRLEVQVPLIAFADVGRVEIVFFSEVFAMNSTVII